ncbi:MAG: hypothetical protein ACXADA_06100 [Candidatus Hodarchaeales archaeon]
MVYQINPKKLTKKPELRSYWILVPTFGLAALFVTFSALMMTLSGNEGIPFSGVIEPSYRFIIPELFIEMTSFFFTGMGGLLFCIGLVKVVQLHWQPDSLANLPRTSKLPFIIGIMKGKESLVLPVRGGKLWLDWEEVKGSPRRWKVAMYLVITDDDFRDKPLLLAKLLLMKIATLTIDGGNDSVVFRKVFPVVEWPKQEYLLKYWLERKEFSNKFP